MLTVMLILLAVACLLAAIILIVIIVGQGKNAALAGSVDRIATSLDAFERSQKEDSQRLRTELLGQQGETRRELTTTLLQQKDSIAAESRNNREETAAALARLNQQINEDAGKNRGELNTALNNLSESLARLNQQINEDAGKNRGELNTSLNGLSESLARKLQELTGEQKTQFEALKSAIEGRLEQIRANNETKLEEMRKTVDEKLQSTLEKRLGESFAQVSERLEQVHKGLGEMRTLASGVGDLKKVLVNVKSRGVMGEIQLGNILEQTLTPAQYVRNFKPFKLRSEVVEFAIQLPGRGDEAESLYLPIDSKFPIEDYHRLVDAFEAGDPDKAELERKALYARIRGCARDIRDKYINPPVTTDFALLFLPFEGLFAEVMRDPDLFETVRRQYQVVIVGPTTVSALLNSLQMGFRTLAIEKRSSEVWNILGAIKTEFGKFGEVLEKTQKKLREASNSIDTAHTRSRQIERKLKKVQELPAEESRLMLDMGDAGEEMLDKEPDEELAEISQTES